MTDDEQPAPVGDDEVVAAVEAIHNESDDGASLEMEKALLEETNKGDDHIPDEPLA